MGERELTVEINGVSRVHRGYTHLFPSFFKREGGSTFRGYWTELRADPPGDRQVHPGWFIGRLIASGYGPSIPVIVSYILHRRRWFIGPFRDARPPPPPPIISDRPSPGGPEIRNRFRAPPFYRPPPTIYPPLCLLPVPQEDAAPNSIRRDPPRIRLFPAVSSGRRKMARWRM